MSAQIFKFNPGERAKSASGIAGKAAAVVPFPSRANGIYLANVVARMRECSDFTAAKDCLAWHADLWWDRLLELGVSDAAAEADCCAFVGVALEKYYRGDDEQGAA